MCIFRVQFMEDSVAPAVENIFWFKNGSVVIALIFRFLY